MKALPDLLSDPKRAILWLYLTQDHLTPSEEGRLKTLLDPESLERWRRFRFEKDRALFLQAHALLRLSLGYATAIDPAHITFTLGEKGRPELAPSLTASPFRFNLSHTSGLVALLMTHTADCGVDVERHGRNNDLEAIAKRHFSSSEFEALMRLSGAAWESRFYRLWTLKESYIKLKGEGLSLPLSRFSFTFLSDRGESSSLSDSSIHLHDRAYPDESPDRWQLLSSLPTAEHTLAALLDREMIDGEKFELHSFSLSTLDEYL